MTKFKELKSTLLSTTTVMLNQTRVNIWLLFLNIYICDLPFDDIDKDLTNYEDDTTPYAYNLESNKAIELPYFL